MEDVSHFMHGHLLRLISGRFLVRAKIINK